MGRHNRRSTEYPNAYVFHVEAAQSEQRIGEWVPEIWLGPWCIWRNDNITGAGGAIRYRTQAEAEADARAELVIRVMRFFSG